MRDEEHKDDMDPSTYGTFVLGDDEYALPAAAIREVVTLPKALSPLHGASDCVLGMFRLRDEVIPVVDTRCVLSGVQRTLPEDPRVAIIDTGTHVFGALFDQTGEVLRTEDDDVRLVDQAGPLVKGVLFTPQADRLITLLDIDTFCAAPRSPKRPSDQLDFDSGFEETIQHILVGIGDLTFAIRTDQSLEVHRSLPVRETIPYFNHCIGLVELRGETVSLLDLRQALGHGRSQTTDRLVFVHDGTTVLAIPVDRVVEVVEAGRQDLQDIALIDQLPSAPFCTSVISRPNARDAYCLDIAALFECVGVDPSCPEGMGHGLLDLQQTTEDTDQFFL